VDHLSEETLKRFASGTSSPQEARAVVAHLLKGCADCARKLRSLIEPEPVADRAYDNALERFDLGLLESLETSISPMQTLRSLLGEGPGRERRR
jgi:hypothetical protein